MTVPDRMIPVAVAETTRRIPSGSSSGSEPENAFPECDRSNRGVAIRSRKPGRAF